MSQIDDGGPAFPGETMAYPSGPAGSIVAATRVPMLGMSLRDWFAGQALNGMCAPLEDGGVYPPDYSDTDFEPWPLGDGSDIVWFKSKSGTWRAGLREDGKKCDGEPHRLKGTYEFAIARTAYRFADAMLAARKAVRP